MVLGKNIPSKTVNQIIDIFDPTSIVIITEDSKTLTSCIKESLLNKMFYIVKNKLDNTLGQHPKYHCNRKISHLNIISLTYSKK